METQQILEKLKAMREEMKADRIAHREFMRQMMARTDDNRERDQDHLKEMMAKTCAETDKLDAHQEKTLAHREATETEPDPRTMQFIEEHQEIPKEEAAVIPVGEPRSGEGSRIWPRSVAKRGRKGPGEKRI
jgi:hypothetical protein